MFIYITNFGSLIHFTKLRKTSGSHSQETLLAISLREDPGRTSYRSLEGTILEPQQSLMEAAEVPSGYD